MSKLSIKRVYDESTRQAFLRIRFSRNGGGYAVRYFNIELLESPAKLRKELVKAGASLKGTKQVQGDAVAALLRSIPAEEFKLTDMPGFRAGGFVLGPQMVGAAKGRYFWKPTDANAGVGARCGTLKGWQKAVAGPAANSTFAMMAVFTALAAPLPTYVKREAERAGGVSPLVTEGAVLNFSGPGSVGKTTLSRLAAGAAGDPDSIADWDFTRRGLEELAAAHNDLPFVLDDTEKHVDMEMPLKTALRLVNQMVPKGKSKAIAGKSRADYRALQWSTMAISSSPKPIEAYAAELGWHRTPGERYRFIDIPLPLPEAGGIFDRAATDDHARKELSPALVARLEAGMATDYGVLMPAWIDYLLAKRRGARIKRYVEKFMSRVMTPGQDGQIGRLATKFGVIYAAGKLAVEAGLLPWGKNDPLNVVKKCYLLALPTLRSDAQLAESSLKDLAALVTDSNRFPQADDGVVTYTDKTIGIRTTLNGEAVCAIRDEDWRRLTPTPAARRRLVELLRAAGAKVPGQGHAGTVQLRVTVSVNGKTHHRPRFWIFRLDKLRAVS